MKWRADVDEEGFSLEMPRAVSKDALGVVQSVSSCDLLGRIVLCSNRRLQLRALDKRQCCGLAKHWRLAAALVAACSSTFAVGCGAFVQ